ncbi:MAG: hypothetical protein GEV03_04900 [Streptosporangiales bacterium]|nr:hypothetical protein [Streptosporangiales bacterium]
MRVWLVLAVVIPLGLAATYFAGPDVSAPAGRTLADELVIVGAKWVAVSLALGLALALADNRVLAWLLVAQAITHAANAVAEAAVGYPSAIVPALVTGALCALAAGWLFRHAEEPPVLRPTRVGVAVGQ